MSASLVGSEMCIRDSVRGEASSPPPRPFRALSGPPPDGRRTKGEDAFTPVSYTHLTLPTICSV
eukprot:5047079-Alexandrium_andersonii.AAC.1